MESNYGLLISKINEFSKKYYLNNLLKGFIYTIALILALYTILFITIYYTRPSVGIKTALFFSYLIAIAIAFFFWMVNPILILLKLRRPQRTEEMAKLIGTHFSDVKDKLLNALQLKSLADQSVGNNALLLASIDQKISELRPIPFSSAIHFNDNRKYLKYLLLPLSIILFIAFLAPSILNEGTNSFLGYNKEILPVAPFHFSLLNQQKYITQGENYTIQLHLQGDQLPQDIYLTEGVNSYKLEKKSITEFLYTFKNVQKNLSFRFSGGGFNSSLYTIYVKPRPSVVNISALIHYPAYLQKKDEELFNTGDLTLPEGSLVNWTVKTEHSTILHFRLGKMKLKKIVEDNKAQFQAILKENDRYHIYPENNYSVLTDSISYSIQVIKDQYPEISVTEMPDSSSSKSLYFSGKITDDHGFSALHFRYNVMEKGKIKSSFSKILPVKNNQTQNSFFFFWDTKNLSTEKDQHIEYYFEVKDNDGVNGPKSSKSAIKTLHIPSTAQITEKIDQAGKTLKQKMENAIKLAGNIEKESKKLSAALLNKKQLAFEDKKQIEQLLEKQKQLEQTVKDIKKTNEQNTQEKEENNLIKEDLIKKQQQIDDLFNHVLDEKTKDLLQKLQDLMNENNKESTSNELSKMQMDNKSLKNELDRILQLYKQLEFEQALQQTADRLNELSKQQNELSKKSLEKNTETDFLKNKQEDLSKSLNTLKNELKKLDEKNQLLEKPNPFQMPDNEISKIERSQKAAQDQLSKQDRGKTSENQKKAAEDLKSLSEKIKETQQESVETESNLNIKELRKLLQNLLNTSFDQEKVMLDLRGLNGNDPKYTSIVQKQRIVKDNMKTIADSLFSLSKRVPQITSTVNEEIQRINMNIDKSLDLLGDRLTPQANQNQQYAMTSINNLTLMLNEALEQLQKMKNSGGNGKGKKQQSMQQLQKMQQQLNSNMQKAKDQLEKNGNKGTAPKGVMSQEMAKMAQQQQMIREALEKINREENKDGKGKFGNLNQMVQDMKLTEEELVNKRIEQGTLKRQRDLLTKLLDAEKAEREQEQDAKRESKTGKDFPPSYQKMLERYKIQQRNDLESFQKLPPDLNYYYKNKISNYFKLLNSTP